MVEHRHGALQPNIIREDQSSSAGATFSGLQTAQAAQVSEANSERNVEAFESREPQGSGLSTEESQNPREGECPLPPPTKSKARKRRGHGWSRRKASRSNPSKNSEGGAIPTNKERRIGEADAKGHKLRSRTRQRVTEPVARPSSVVPTVSEGLPTVRNIRSLRSHNIVMPAANGGTTRDRETNRTIQTAVPGWTVERPRVDGTQSTEPESTPVKIEEEEDQMDFQLYSPGPSNYFSEVSVNTPTSESVFQYDSDPGTPGLMAEGNENRPGESNALHSTPVQTLCMQSIERLPRIVTPGTIQPYWATEEGDEEEDENDASESVVVVNRERSIAPSPPSLSPSHPGVRGSQSRTSQLTTPILLHNKSSPERLPPQRAIYTTEHNAVQASRIEATNSNETPLTHSGRSRTKWRRLKDASESSTNVSTNAFSTTTGSVGAFQPNITIEDQFSNTQAVQIVKTESTKNNSHEPQGSGISSESSQNPCKAEGSQETRAWVESQKTARTSTQGCAVQMGRKHRVESTNGEEDEPRPTKGQHTSEAAAAITQHHPFVLPDDLANSGRGESNRIARSPSLHRQSAIEDMPAIGVDFTLIKMEDEEEDYLFDTLLPCDWSMLILETEPTSEVTFLVIRMPRVQSVDAQSFDESLILVPSGTIEEVTPLDELVAIADEDEDEGEIDDNVSGSLISVDRERLRAPSPPTLPPLLPVLRFTILQCGEEAYNLWASISVALNSNKSTSPPHPTSRNPHNPFPLSNISSIMVFTRNMTRQLPAAETTSINEAGNNDVLLVQPNRSPVAHPRSSPQTTTGRSTAVYDNAVEGSAEVRTNAFSTDTGSHGALSTNIITEDQPLLAGAWFSNLQTAQVSEVRSERNDRPLVSRQPQGSGLSIDESQNPCEDVSSPPPTKPKSRKQRGHRWSRKKASRSSPSKNSEDSAIPTSKKRRIGEADHELGAGKRQRITAAVAEPSSVVPAVSEGPPIVRNIRSLRSRNIIIPAANGGTTRHQETNRAMQIAEPGLTVEKPTVNDAQSTEPESTLVKIEEEDETNFLFYAPGPSNYLPEAPVNTTTSQSVFQYDSSPGTPGLTAEDNENRGGESNSLDSTPVMTLQAQSIERSPSIVTLGTIEEDQSYWAAEESDEEEDENDTSESVVYNNRERSMAPSPPSLSPSHPAVRPATPRRVEEPQRDLHWVLVARVEPLSGRDSLPRILVLKGHPCRPCGSEMAYRRLAAFFLIENNSLTLSEVQPGRPPQRRVVQAAVTRDIHQYLASVLENTPMQQLFHGLPSWASAQHRWLLSFSSSTRHARALTPALHFLALTTALALSSSFQWQFFPSVLALVSVLRVPFLSVPFYFRFAVPMDSPHFNASRYSGEREDDSLAFELIEIILVYRIVTHGTELKVRQEGAVLCKIQRKGFTSGQDEGRRETSQGRCLKAFFMAVISIHEVSSTFRGGSSRNRWDFYR
ncbi:uncharacterized protein FOMMEDRAFT_160426 [Fomitiporia mediterranea MF3/22]|uniref:uncharacterized protein n=1 Tax=Fomitiporia mediterranea (strain MF3/22) TaxID=694068 RepID=UPI0004409945|nr:uncharacterized protein FOMMEDRAFT_160426 [Fomitiporia mediterranea MF3/22]EJC99401.1 hypothetical protein FOMMEDRAFT_160426 [Fomitiporia mediterranea MF3/22]